MSLVYPKERHLIPNWRSPKETLDNGELGTISPVSSPIVKPFDLSEYEEGWKRYNEIPYAAELICAASIHNNINDEARNAAEFIVNHSDNVSEPLLNLASCILSGSAQKDSPQQTAINEDNISVDKIEEIEQDSMAKVHLWRTKVLSAPYDPIRRIELARWLLRVGSLKNAEKETITALHLSSSNRYITRCAARCFIDLRDLDRAKHALGLNPFLKNDPWLMATDIGIDLLNRKSPRSAKRGIQAVASRSFSPLAITELASALASLEYQRGGTAKKIKSYIKESLRDPIDNSLAQSQWLANMGNYGVYIPINQSVKFNYEAETFDCYNSKDYETAYKKALLWFIDSGFSRRSTLVASNLISLQLGNIEEAVRILKIGLKANKSDAGLLNNLAFLLLSSGEKVEGKAALEKAFSVGNLNDVGKVHLMATRGLYEFRYGSRDKGRELYNNAISLAKRSGPDEVYKSAKINFIRESFLAGESTKEQCENELKSIKCYDPDVESLKSNILKSLL